MVSVPAPLEFLYIALAHMIFMPRVVEVTMMEARPVISECSSMPNALRVPAGRYRRGVLHGALSGHVGYIHRVLGHLPPACLSFSEKREYWRMGRLVWGRQPRPTRRSDRCPSPCHRWRANKQARSLTTLSDPAPRPSSSGVNGDGTALLLLAGPEQILVEPLHVLGQLPLEVGQHHRAVPLTRE